MATFAAFVDDDAKLGLKDKADFKAHLERLKGQNVIVTVKRTPRRHGNQSMRYYRGVVIPDVARACGYADPDDWPSIHDAMAWKFLRLPDSEFGTPRRRSTAKDQMSQDEITDYISQVILFAETSIPDCKIRRPDEIDEDAIIDQDWE